MEYYLIPTISIILLVLGLVGTFLPILPGLVLSFIGLVLYKFGTTNDLSMVHIWVFGILTLASIVLNYIIPAKATKKYGGTSWGSIGSIVGTILGLFFIPLPLGFLVGMFLGVFIGELLENPKNLEKAWNSTKGAFIGFIYGTIFNFLICFTMLSVVIMDIL